MFFNKITISNLINKFKNDFFKNVSYNFIFYSLNLVLVYLLAIVITKVLGAEVYGRYSIIKSMIMVLIIFNSLGLNTNAIRLSAHKDYFNQGFFKSDYFLKSCKILLLLSIFFTIIILIFKKHLALSIFKDPEFEKYLSVFPIILFFSVFLNFNSNVLKGQGKILSFSFVSSFLNNCIFLVLVIVGFSFFKLSDEYLMYFLAASFFVAYIISFYNVKPFKKTKKIKKTSYSKLIKDSLPMMLSSTMIFLIFSLDTLMIAFFETTEKVGVYRVVSQISSINGIFLIIFSSVIAPKVANYYSRNLNSKIETIVVDSSRIILNISFPLLIIILFFHEKILLFFGSNFLSGKTAIIVLSICQFLYAYTGLVDLVLNMTEKQKVFGKVTFISAFFNIVLNLILIPKYAITGAAVATGISLIITNFLAALYIKNKLGFYPFYIPFKSFFS